jgi:hypothetical protein
MISAQGRFAGLLFPEDVIDVFESLFKHSDFGRRKLLIIPQKPRGGSNPSNPIPNPEIPQKTGPGRLYLFLNFSLSFLYPASISYI